MKVNFWEVLADLGFIEAEIQAVKEQLATSKPGDQVNVTVPNATLTVDHRRLGNVTISGTVE